MTELLHSTHRDFADVHEGRVADYIPALAGADPRHFGLAFAGVDGTISVAGDARVTFSLQSLSKPFVFALVCQAIGTDEARARIGVNSTGFPFDSSMAVELGRGPTNPMVNAGAIATTSLVPGGSADAKWDVIQRGLSAFAGRPLTLNHEVYQSEAHSNQRNQGIAREMARHGLMYFEPLAATDVYTRQCSLDVTVEDLAVMGATLANGGRNPETGEVVVDRDSCIRTQAVLATAGLYEQSGEWLYETGLPAKSGVSGGIVGVSSGIGGLASYSPPVDGSGNSVRGQLAITQVSSRLGLGIFSAVD
ncbi:MAG: glutaminase A [Rhodoglobus sp.]